MRENHVRAWSTIVRFTEGTPSRSDELHRCPPGTHTISWSRERGWCVGIKMLYASDDARRQAAAEVTLGRPRRGDGLSESASTDCWVIVDAIGLAVAEPRPLGRLGGYPGNAFRERGELL